MIKNLKIKVTIGDRVYPLTIRDEGEEEGIRAAVKKINEMIKNFEQNYEVRDKQDVLAMCALQFASIEEIKSVRDDHAIKEAEDKLLALTKMLDNQIN